VRRSIRDAQAAFAKGVVALLEKEGVAFDIGALSRCAVRASHMGGRDDRRRPTWKALMPWLAWAFETQKADAFARLPPKASRVSASLSLTKRSLFPQWFTT
jgi:hypothetical protein